MDLIRFHPSTENVVDLSVFELMMLMATPFHHVTIISLFNLQINTMNYCIELCSHSPFLLHMYQIHGKILYVSWSLYLLLAFPSLAFVPMLCRCWFFTICFCAFIWFCILENLNICKRFLSLSCFSHGRPPYLSCHRIRCTVSSINGSSFTISRVDRLNMGAFLCIGNVLDHYFSLPHFLSFFFSLSRKFLCRYFNIQAKLKCNLFS